MQLIPLDRKAAIVLVVAAMVPMAPLLGTEISLTDILSKLAELMV